ncbi:class I SAM-dependent methyltransferase [Winogradskyella flava]|uniref:class I SAM-dependent methyltransferase n=1 Tax=Winogradskyella flava TaxID=1884876 RepID=UPI0024904848|nr:class I SAM-dependent methyltransferase [Winogradskyella flava]
MNLYDDKNINYAAIFDRRGDDYHKAMKLIPSARDNEFISLLNQSVLKDGMTVVDIPSGGNYLSNYINQKVTLFPLETSEVFAKLGNSKLCSWSLLPLENNSIDVIFTCAAFHHVVEMDRKKFMEEASRVLKTDGKLVIADVKAGTAVDQFLNTFVDKNNSLGHKGVFMDDTFSKAYETASLKASASNFLKFPWVLSNIEDISISYLKLMFGIDKASQSSIKKEIAKTLNFQKTETGNYTIDWALNYEIFTKII